MTTTTTIAIIGKTPLAQTLSKGGYRILLFGGECKEGELMDCPIEASWEADIIVLAAQPEEMAEKIRAVAVQKIVLSNGSLETWQTLLPHSKVVAFSNLSPAQRVINISGDDGEALYTTAELLRSVGFFPDIQLKRNRL
ncbi:hypothetical protein AAHN97_22360 [Chitinophaga niabensis]|uniref:hypothetical protein n=1 Tax=Chitinophaga niabensis TaxID=536979 RepID=UPI0031BA4312